MNRITYTFILLIVCLLAIASMAAQTPKSSTDLYTNLADNTTGAVDAEDLRDVVASGLPVYAMMGSTTSAETTIAAVDTPVKAAGTTEDVLSSSTMTVATTNRITYTGTPDIVCSFVVAAECVVDGNIKVVGVGFAKNGTPIDTISRLVSTGSDVGAFGNNWMFELSTNDYVEVWVDNSTDSTNMTLNNFHVTAFGRIQ